MAKTFQDRQPGFLVHNEGDDVAVAVDDIEPGRAVVVYMDSNRDVEVAVREKIPLGHKIALNDLASGADVIEYGVRIGLARSAIGRGQLVHVHNVRSARWQSSR
jgi:(2R)-sulfolactate sulfo-lyase subunit alpha